MGSPATSPEPASAEQGGFILAFGCGAAIVALCQNKAMLVESDWRKTEGDFMSFSCCLDL